MRTGVQGVYTFYMPTRIVHGANSVRETGKECKNLGITKAAIVTDKGVSTVGLVDGVCDSLKNANVPYVLFDEVEEDPGVATVSRGAEYVLREKCDGLIAVGGGSSICAGRGIGVVATNGGTIRDYVGINRASKPPLSLIAIPTTAGSGAEVSQVIILKDHDRETKIVVGSPLYFPKVAILDPLLLRTLSFRQFVISGIDAIAHAIEAYLTTMTTPITDCLALSSVNLIYHNLRPAACSEDLDAKEACLIGSTMANVACGNARLGLAHAITQPMEGMFKIPHGLAIGTMLPHVMEFNLIASPERFRMLAGAMGQTEGSGVGDWDLSRSAITAVKRLLVDLGFPRKFSESQIGRESIPRMAKMLMGGLYGGEVDPAKDYPMQAVVPIPNIRKVTMKDVVELYEKAFTEWQL